MVAFSMNLSDLNPGFKVTVYLQVEYLKKTVRFRDKVTKEHIQSSLKELHSVA